MAEASSTGLSYAALSVGERLGSRRYILDRALLEEWRDIHAGAQKGERDTPPGGLVFVFGLRALMDIAVIPPGGILATHDLRFVAMPECDEPIKVALSCTDKFERNGLPFAILNLALSCAGRPLVSDEMRVLWPGDEPAPLPKRRDEAPRDDGRTVEADAYPFTVTQDAVERYAELSRDRNPIHLDSAYAAAGPFGRLVVHATIPAGYMLQEIAAAAPDGLAGLRCHFKFLSPLGPEERFAVRPPAGPDMSGTWECRTGDETLVCISEVSDDA